MTVDGAVDPSDRQSSDQHDLPGAALMRPSDDVRAELIALLEADQSRLGQVYRLVQQGLDAYAIAEQLDVASTSFVWN
jgi:DNA-binding NarL/FixJ family response regulator